jgi:predicted RNase H-like HicB family nuclease
MLGQPTGHYPTLMIEELHKNGSITWYAGHPDLPGCHATGQTVAEAQDNLERSREAWIAWAASQNLPLPKTVEYPLVTFQYAPRPDAVSTLAAPPEATRDQITVSA